MKTLRLALAAVLAFGASIAHALTTAPYDPAAVARAMKAGAPLVLHFHADWCPTCRAQDKVLRQLESDPALELTVYVVDYDKETQLRRELKVPVQATFIAYHGSAERARSSGQTDPAQVKALLEAALH